MQISNNTYNNKLNFSKTEFTNLLYKTIKQTQY